MKRISILILFSLVTACGGQTTYIQKAQKSLAVTYEAVQVAEKAFVSWDTSHQQEIVAKSNSPEEAAAALNAYRDKRQPVIKAFVVAYSSIASIGAIIPLVEKGLKPESDLMTLLSEAFMASIEVKRAIEAIGAIQ